MATRIFLSLLITVYGTRGAAAMPPAGALMFGNDGVIQKKRQLASTNLPVNVEIGFSIRPSSALEKKWSNIIHFTTGLDCCGYGSRVPGVFFYPNSHKLIFVSGQVANGNFASTNWHCKDALLTLSPNRDYKVKMVLQQKYINLYVNGQAACSHVPRGSVKPLKNVKVYMSNPWYAAAKATVKDFYLKELSPPAQKTCGGTAKGARCVFPFVYKGKKYNSCTKVDNHNKLWCATESVYKNKWGSCDCGAGIYQGKWTALNNAGVKVTASSSWSKDYTPDKLVDAGNAPWHGKGKGTNEWLMFAFAQPTKLDGFRTKAPSGWDGSSFKDYRFEESNDGKHWNIIKSGQGKNQDCKNTDCDWQEIRWPSTTAKYFRLFMVNNWGYGWLSIDQLELSLFAPLKCASGSPSTCKVTSIHAPGYSAGGLARVTNGLRVKRSIEKHSCPDGYKIWSPRNKKDWTIVFNALGKNINNYPKKPSLIIDVTRRANGCGGCTKYAMKSGVHQQSSWKTTDGSPWWLRDAKYNEPNGDYNSFCYLHIYDVNPNNVRFNDGSCSYTSTDYLCQPIKKTFQKTCGGTAKGARCVFPFFYKGNRYTSCTTLDNHNKPWCATERVYKNKWGNCNCGAGIIQGKWTALNNAGVKVTASSSWSKDYTPNKLVDAGNAPWHSKDKNTNAWLMFAFAQPTKLDGFRTKAPSGWDGSSFKDYRFEESNDGKHWKVIKSGQGKNQDCKNTDCDWQEIRMQPTTAKYFRLFMVNNWGYGWLSIDQLELSLFDIKICKCSGGIAATGAGCPSDGAESCASCNKGSFLLKLPGHAMCLVNQCKCPHGTGALGSKCPHEGSHACINCDYGFSLTKDGRGCAAKKCKCSNGRPASSYNCPKNGAERCSRCNKGYFMNARKGYPTCSVNTCVCWNGKASVGRRCPSHGAEACAACSNGYVLHKVRGRSMCIDDVVVVHGRNLRKDIGE